MKQDNPCYPFVEKLVKELLSHDIKLSVDYGEGYLEVENSSDYSEIINALGECDEEWLWTSNNSFAFLIYCNEPHEVLTDYGVSLEPYIKDYQKFEDSFF